MTFDACQCIYERSLEIPFFFINDIFITGFAAEACNIRRRHYEAGFSSERKSIENINSTSIVIHYMDKEAKKQTWDKLNAVTTTTQEPANTTHESETYNYTQEVASDAT